MRRPITRENLREELSHNLQIGLGAGLIGGGLLGLLAAAATLVLNPVLLRSGGDVVRLVLGLQVVYAILCLALGVLGATIKALLFLLAGRQVSDTKTAALITGVIFFLLGGFYALSWCRWHKIGGLGPDTPIGIKQLPVLLLVALVSAVLARILTYAFYLLYVYVKKPERRHPGDLRRAFFVIVYMAVVFVLFVAVMRVTAHPSPSASGLTQDAVHPTGKRVLLLGVDGLEEGDIGRLQAKGLLAWAGPFLRGARGTVLLPSHPVPPMVWTVVATGRDLAAHGDLDYETQVVKGLSTPLRIGPNQIGLYDLFHTVLPFFRMTRSVPVKSYMRESKGLWNMLTDAGLRTVVVNWWVSWPAERVRGSVVSDHAWLKLTGETPGAGGSAPGPAAAAQTAARAAASVQTPGRGMTGAMSPLRPDGQPLLLERETWPSTLLIEISALAGSALPETLAARYGGLPSPEALASFDRLGIPPDVLRSDLFYAQSAAWLLDREHPDLWMLHLPGADIVKRVLLKRIPDPAAREAARREALEVYWRTLDPALTRCLQREALLLWVALPGIAWSEARSEDQTGVVALAGRGSQSGRLATPFKLADITPTVLWLLGLPVSQEMDGVPRIDALAGEDALWPVRWIPGYGHQEIEGLEEAAGTLDQEMMERFRSLGYIR